MAVSIPAWEHSLHSIRAFLVQDRPSMSVCPREALPANQYSFTSPPPPPLRPVDGVQCLVPCSPLPDHCRARRSRNLIIFSAVQTTDDICLARALMSVWFGGELAII